MSLISLQQAMDKLFYDNKKMNDNFSQTPIQIGEETLKTVDDKLNFLIKGRTHFEIIDFEEEGTKKITCNFKPKYVFICSTDRYRYTMYFDFNGEIYAKGIYYSSGPGELTVNDNRSGVTVEKLEDGINITTNSFDYDRNCRVFLSE